MTHENEISRYKEVHSLNKSRKASYSSKIIIMASLSRVATFKSLLSAARHSLADVRLQIQKAVS